MSITSADWLLWMIITIVLFWASPARFRDLCLPLITLAFLLSHAPLSAAILVTFTVAIYLLTTRFRSDGAVTLGAGLAVVAVLGYFKLEVAELRGDPLLQVAIPLGLSYYAFRCLHYLIESYKGTIASHGFREFAAYLIFLPTLAAGPIHRFDEFHRDHRRHRWDAQRFSVGLERILFGYVKVVVLANQLVNVNLQAYIESIDSSHQWLIAYLDMLAFGLNGYLQFAGYSDIAIGFALLLGYRVMENFNWPFLARNISEFWQRWHISLSSWCRNYIYMVVTSISRKPTLAILLSMLVLGLWHEISLRYLLWGAYHGIGIAVWHAWSRLASGGVNNSGPVVSALGHVLSVLTTFHFVMLSFVILHHETLVETLDTYRLLLTGWW